MRAHEQRVGVTILVMLGAAVLSLAGCARSSSETSIEVRGADDVQVVSADEAARLIDAGEGRAVDVAAGSAATDEAEDEVAISESSRSFQTRLGTALATFNGCLGDKGFRFVGLPGTTEDPLAADPDYLPALIACNNESGIAAVLQEQNSRQAALSAEEKVRLNEEATVVFECLTDRGWEFGPLEPNENGILTASAFPDDISSRPDEFARDLDSCGWNDLDLG